LIALLDCLAGLLDSGATLLHRDDKQLVIEGRNDLLAVYDLSALRDHKAFCLSLLPRNKAITVDVFYDGLEHYQERIAIMVEGSMLSEEQAKHYARLFVISLLKAA
jgi:hypothetical protein